MKKIISLAIVWLAVQLVAIAQEDNAQKFAATITTADLQKHLTIIASDEMEGRETGTEGQRRAAEYIETQFKSMGLKTVDSLKGYQQFFPLYIDSLVKSELKVNGKTAQFGKDYYSQSTLSENGRFKTKKIVFAGYGIDDSTYSDYEGLNVKGKIVVIFSGEPKNAGKYLVSGTSSSSVWTFPGTVKKITAATARGAAGVFIINANLATFMPRVIETNRKSNVYYPRKDSITIEHAFLTHEFARTVIDNLDTLLQIAKAGKPFDQEWKVGHKLKVSYQYEKNRSTVTASNVVGVLDGTDKKDEFVFLTGHYDHLGKRDGKIYYGADDDGSGTCAVIEMANAFTKAKAAGFGPRRTIVFMTVSGEEKGLWGSEYYSDNPLFPLEKTSADLNTDMVGRTDTERKTDDTLNYVYVIGHDKLSSDLPVINEGVNKKYTNLVLDYKYDDPKDQNRIYYRSDHYNFARKGVPILFFYDGMLKADYHKPTDTIDKINWDLYEKRVKMIFHTAWEIANRDELLKRDIPLPAGSR